MFSKGRKTSLIIDFVYKEVEQEIEEDVDIDIEIPPYILKNILDNSYTWKADSSTNSRYCKFKSHPTALKSEDPGDVDKNRQTKLEQYCT